MSFTVYKSSAGAGKTFALVKEYLKIVLSVDDPLRYRQILAITFTNKAAAEMKERIISALKDLSDLKNCSPKSRVLLDILLSELQCSEAEIETKSEKILRTMLHNYSDIAISTIDKFVHRIIRTFAYDLKIPLNFNVELDGDKMLKQAIDTLISKVGSEEKLTKALIDFTESKADEEKSWHIENDLHQFSKNLLDDESSEFIKKIKHLTLDDFSRIKTTIYDAIKKYDNQLSDIGNNALQLIAAKNISADKFAGGERSGITKYFTYLSEKKFDRYEPTDTVKKNTTDDKWYSTKAVASDKQSIDSIKNELLDLFLKAISYIAEHDSKINVYRLLLKNIYALALLNEIDKILQEIKSQYGILHISEFNKRISEIVTLEPTPFIYERIGVKFKNFLIDEFQDTSVLQWQNLLPLIDNSLGESNFNLIVGDGKQAIYRWRGGEVEQFSALPQLLKQTENPVVQQRQQSLERNYKEELLDSNYRSKAEIVSFNNELFKLAAQALPDSYKKIYENNEQKFDVSNTGGFVNIEFIEKNKQIEGHYDNETCKKISDTIHNLINNYNYEYKDICIITKKNSQGNLIAQYLIKQNIPVVSKESLLLSTSENVNFIIAILQLLCNPSDSVAKAEAIKFVLQNNALLQDYHAYLIKYKNSLSLLHFFEESIGKYLELKWNELPVYETCENLIREFNLGETADPYVQFFLDAVYAYSNKNNNSIYYFIDWWAENNAKLSVILPEGLQAVNIMTIHKSKGLQYPVILFPFANWKTESNAKYAWVNINDKGFDELKSAILPLSKQLEKTQYASLYEDEKAKSLLDSLNVLYVACTRPEERLYIFSSLPEANQNVSQIFVDYLQSKHIWEPSKTSYIIGSENNKHTTNNKQHSKQIMLKTLSGYNWREKISISKSYTKIWQEASSEVSFGNIIHSALEFITHEKNIDFSLEQLLKKGLISVNEAEPLKKYLAELLNNEKVKPFFALDNEFIIEKEIIDENGKTFRPDRVIIRDNKTIVVDFKTGKLNDKNRKQVKEYGLLLKDMGYSNIETYLIQTEDKTVELVR